jgi:hypothetical protein
MTIGQAEIIQLDRFFAAPAAHDDDAVITQAGAYKIRTASNGESAILL